jgi:hypothetical protein
MLGCVFLPPYISSIAEGISMERKIFVSVGRTSTPAQEDFVCAIEERLRAEGLIPCTVGRNTWTAGAPLKKVVDLMTECVGVVIIALERTYYPEGIEHRGGTDPEPLKEVCLPTSFNQIEAAMAYTFGRPMLVIVEQGLRQEGLLEEGNDWFVQRLKVDRQSLSSQQFSGILANWKEDITSKKWKRLGNVAVADMSIVELLGSLKIGQLWATAAALVTLLGGAFSLGAKFFPVQAVTALH